MADIYDTLHPVNTPADNLYPNINPEQNIPDGSISKQKLNFPIGGQGAAAILPGEEYVDIAYNGNPGSVLFPKGTYFIYTRDGWLNNTPPYTGTYNTVSDDFDVMAYWYDVSDNVIKSSEATPSDDGIILSIPEDDFLVMVLIRNPNENGPRVIPVYSIIPTSLLKYNTRDYDWAALQVTGFTINDGEYPQLGCGYLVDQFSNPVVSANTNYYKICNMKIVSADIGRDIVSASAIVWIAATTGSTINTAFVSLNLVMDTLTQDYSASGATFVGGAFDSGKLVYTIEFDADKSELTITLYAALSKDAMLAAGNVCYVRYRDAQGDRQSTVPFFYGTDTGSASAPSNSIPVKQIGTYRNFIAGGVQAELIANNSSLNSCIPDEIGMWKMWYVPTDGSAQTIGDKPAEVTTAFKVDAIKIHEVTGGVRVIQRLNDMRSNEFARYGTENGSGGTTFQAWKEIVTSYGSYPTLGAGKDGDGNVISKTYAPIASPEFTGTPTAPTPPAGDNSKRIATTGWVQSTSGAKTAYHHHIQALILSTLPDGASNYNAQCYFEIVTDTSAPITTAAELYNALMSLEYNATETRYTPASGGMWVTTIPEPPTSGVNADVIVGIRATDEYEPQNPDTDSRAIVVQQYRVGLSRSDGPFYNVPFYYAGLSTSKSIHDTVTDQYGHYIAGGD